MIEKKRDVIIIGGITGSGKTYFANNLLLEYPRVILVSPIEADEDEYHGIMTDSLDDLVEQIEEKVTDGKAEWRFKISDLSEFDELCGFAYDLGKVTGGLMIAIEESQRIIPARAILTPQFKNILYRGRHSQVSLCVIAQRFSTISIEVRSQWRRIISFRQTEPADVAWLSASTGRDVDDLPQFHDREYLDITPHSYHHHGGAGSEKSE